MNTFSQSEHIYNHIEVSYGQDSIAEKKDDDSIRDNKRKLLELKVPVIDDHQSEWAEWIADKYLERFQDVHFIIDIKLPTTFFINLADIVFIDQEDVAYMSMACQVLNISQNPSEQTTTLKLVTL